MIEQLQFPELVDIKDAATRLSTSIRHVRRLAQDDKLPFVKIGGKLRFDLADLRRYIEENRHAGTTKAAARANRARGTDVLGARRPSERPRLA